MNAHPSQIYGSEQTSVPLIMTTSEKKENNGSNRCGYILCRQL